MNRPRCVPVLLVALLAGCDVPSGSVQAGPPAKMNIVSGDRQSGVIRSELPLSLVVRVTDEAGTPAPGVPVRWAILSGGGALGAVGGTTDRDGLATNRWTLGSQVSLPQVVEAVAVGEAGALLTARFKAIPAPGAAASLEQRAGNQQTGTAGATLKDSLVVVALDAYRNPVPGVALTWHPSAGQTSSTTTTTRRDGASSVAWTLGASAGGQSVRVVADTLGATFTATASSGASGSRVPAPSP